jgi:hypothetical protein
VIEQTERQACVSQPVQVRPEETPGSSVVHSPAGREILTSKREVKQLTGPQHQANLAASSINPRNSGDKGEPSP